MVKWGHYVEEAIIVEVNATSPVNYEHVVHRLLIPKKTREKKKLIKGPPSIFPLA